MSANTTLERPLRAAREDPELRGLIEDAMAGFARSRSAVVPAYGDQPRRSTPVFTAVVASLAIVLVSVRAFVIDSPPSEPGESGELADAARFVHRRHDAPRSGSFFVAAVSRPPQGWSNLEEAKQDMASARRNAVSAAGACMGRSALRAGVEISDRGVVGGSAGLIFALTVLDAMDGRDLAHGKRIAGTGTIAPDGRVGPISSVEIKARAAERAKADLFIVPASQASAARRAAPGLTVTGVRTLDDAVRLLTGGGGCVRTFDQPPD